MIRLLIHVIMPMFAIFDAMASIWCASCARLIMWMMMMMMMMMMMRMMVTVSTAMPYCGRTTVWAAESINES